MMSVSRLRVGSSCARLASSSFQQTTRRSFAVSAFRAQDASSSSSSSSSSSPSSSEAALTPQSTTVPSVEIQQAPNRPGVWSRSQQPREKAMTGPRFEQTIFELQPQPYSAMELIHKQPVTWTHDRVVSCDGGGGPHGHPRIFINTDKPQIAVCGYCGLPYANEHHRKHLEALPETSYPLA